MTFVSITCCVRITFCFIVKFFFCISIIFRVRITFCVSITFYVCVTFCGVTSFMLIDEYVHFRFSSGLGATRDQSKDICSPSSSSALSKTRQRGLYTDS